MIGLWLIGGAIVALIVWGIADAVAWGLDTSTKERR